MSDRTSYNTIEKPVESFLKVMGSKFHGCAFPMSSEDQLKDYLELCKTNYPNATHYCYAWRLGPDGNRAHHTDDGEPSNSAGAPIARQLVSADLYDVLIVVIRYYGGKKLGVGGLISAYGDSAKLTLEAATTIEVKPVVHLLLKDHANRDYKVYEFANRYQLEILVVGSPFILKVDQEQQKDLESALKELPNFDWSFTDGAMI